uniref:C3H1-type domain-containing protein n=1 Tax=Guillardia theta TaxID=55529 RepID=A0A7S4PFF3_GUITH
MSPSGVSSVGVSALPTVKLSTGPTRVTATVEAKQEGRNGSDISSLPSRTGQPAKISALSSFLNSPEMQNSRQKPSTPKAADEACKEVTGDVQGDQPIAEQQGEQPAESPTAVHEETCTESPLDWERLFNLISDSKETISRDQFLAFLKDKGREILGIDDDDEEMIEALFNDMTNDAFKASDQISRADFFKVFEVTEHQQTGSYSKSPQAKKKRRSREFPGQGYVCQHCGKEGGKKDSHWHQNCPVLLQSQNPEHLKRLKGKVVSKVEKSQQGEGRELAFIKMESSPGVADVYVPKSIFIGHDLEDWKRVRKGSVMEVMAHHMVRGSNRWRAATFLNLCTEEGQSPANRPSADNRNSSPQVMQSSLKPVNVRAAFVQNKRKRSSRGNDDDLIESRVINDRTGRNEIAKIKEVHASQEKKHKTLAKDIATEGNAPPRPQAPAAISAHGEESRRLEDGPTSEQRQNQDDTDSEDEPTLSIDEDEDEDEDEVEKEKAPTNDGNGKSDGKEERHSQRLNSPNGSNMKRSGKDKRQGTKDRHTSSRAGKRKKIDADCTFWLKGCCNKGDACPFSHQAEPPMIVCKFLLRGDCSRGDACSFSHDLSRIPCKFFHVGGNCSKGAACPFGHAALTEDQREWVEREWKVNSKEMKELLAKALRTEQEAKARVEAGEEVHVEDVSGRGPAMIWGEDDVWLGIPITTGTAGLQQDQEM